MNKTSDAIMPSYTSIPKEDIYTKKVKQDVISLLQDESFKWILSMQVKSLNSFIAFNKSANEALNELFIVRYRLNLKEQKFIESFKSSNISTFKWNDKEKEEIMDLIEKKKYAFQKLLVECIERWNFYFPKEDLDDIVNLIWSWIFEWKDSLYRKYLKLIETNHQIDLWSKLYYGLPDWMNAWSYKSSLLSSDVDPKKILNIHNDNIRNYLAELICLSSIWNNNYDDWIKAEKCESDNWWWTSNLVFLAPMENYIHKNFVDPEFLVLLREKTEFTPAEFENLSMKFYWNSYGMDKVKAYYVEEILKWWNATFEQYLWKTFPNDVELKKNLWTFIWIVKWEFAKTFNEYYKMIAKIFNIELSDMIALKDEIVEWSKKETTFHEYWHSLFWSKSSDLEETKASLFYWLHLYNKYVASNAELELQEIKRIMYSFTIDFTRYISRMEEPRYRKYVYTSQILLHYMQDNSLLWYDSEKNCLNMNLDNESETIIRFKSLLRDLAGVLDTIKSIYDDNDPQREQNLINYYDEETLPTLQLLYKNF
ncbi:MAG: hypothetical protein ACD_3C00206G0002 [uncultured bacterium (gcode 4)]|uniref:Uncharacterized protein n=1 Tax=uncultured bacterium (gcode 4) TaxID=1234023 RepID=K2GVR8_9BACT|nr:MAG: hypothetical protein ACD_3C00206G0002 [uncultured bacterium (gcode 4)]